MEAEARAYTRALQPVIVILMTANSSSMAVDSCPEKPKTGIRRRSVAETQLQHHDIWRVGQEPPLFNLLWSYVERFVLKKRTILSDQ
jgi:hypothetical protein